MLARRWPWDHFGDAASQVDVLKVALAVVAAIGAAVALVVNYRRQQHLERDEAGRRDQVRLFTERFGAAAAQLGGEQAAVRLAGVYAMAALADEWEAQRQQCIDVLCGYLRLPYAGEPDSGYAQTLVEQRQYAEGRVQRTRTTTFRSGERQVRSMISWTIRGHLVPDAQVSWSDLTFDFTGATLPDVSYDGARFAGMATSFAYATFVGPGTNFWGAEFHGRYTSFEGARFRAGSTNFDEAMFSGSTSFAGARFSRCATISFAGARFAGPEADFCGARFGGKRTSFAAVKISGTATFERARFSSKETNFDDANFTDETDFRHARFSSNVTSFRNASFADVSTAVGAAEFAKPENVVWGPTPPTSSSAGSGAPA